MHTLIAGVSGSGKSYVENLLIKQILGKDAALMLIDPKRVELSEYKDNPKVIRYAAEIDDCIDSLYQAESIMMDRYRCSRTG